MIPGTTILAFTGRARIRPRRRQTRISPPRRTFSPACSSHEHSERLDRGSLDSSLATNPPNASVLSNQRAALQTKLTPPRPSTAWIERATPEGRAELSVPTGAPRRSCWPAGGVWSPAAGPASAFKEHSRGLSRTRRRAQWGQRSPCRSSSAPSGDPTTLRRPIISFRRRTPQVPSELIVVDQSDDGNCLALLADLDSPFPLARRLQGGECPLGEMSGPRWPRDGCTQSLTTTAGTHPTL